MFRFSESDRSLPLLATRKARAETYRHRGHSLDYVFLQTPESSVAGTLCRTWVCVWKALLLGGQSKMNRLLR